MTEQNARVIPEYWENDRIEDDHLLPSYREMRDRWQQGTGGVFFVRGHQLMTDIRKKAAARIRDPRRRARVCPRCCGAGRTELPKPPGVPLAARTSGRRDEGAKQRVRRRQETRSPRTADYPLSMTQRPSAVLSATRLAEVLIESGVTPDQVAQRCGYFVEDVYTVFYGRAFPAAVINRIASAVGATHQEIRSKVTPLGVPARTIEG